MNIYEIIIIWMYHQIIRYNNMIYIERQKDEMKIYTYKYLPFKTCTFMLIGFA